MTTFSPSTVGSVATRTSSMRPAAAALSEMRPSCGLRRSAMSSFASTFRRVVTPADIRFGMRCTSASTPSMRKRTTSASSCGSKWMSEAPSSAAWKMTELTSRTSGASEIPSSASRSSPSSSASCSATSSSSTASRAAVAPEARATRFSSARMSSREATPRSSVWRVARRSSSSCWTFDGSATATRSVEPSNAYGIATMRSRTWSGISFAAAASTPVSPSSTRAMPERAARIRATPSEEATPSSASACASEPPWPARPFTSARRSSGTSPVAASRSRTSSACGFTDAAGWRRAPSWPVPGSAVRRFGSSFATAAIPRTRYRQAAHAA